MNKTKTDSPLSYFGSDAKVAARIGCYFAPCNHVTIPFCGGLSILPHLKGRVVANDLNHWAMTFYKVLRVGHESDSKRLIELCQNTLSHPSDLETAKEALANPNHAKDSVLAWAYWALCWLGRGGHGGTDRTYQQTNPSFRMSASGGSNATRVRAAAEDLPVWAEHFRRCEFVCLDFRELLTKVHWNDPKCGVYIDPPWVDDGDAYVHKFTEKDHRDVEEAVSCLLKTDTGARLLLRYGDHPLIRDLYREACWNITEVESRNQGNNTVQEVWITNYPE